MKEWLNKGGYLDLDNMEDWNELYSIRFKASLGGKIKLMTKDEMRMDGIKSPNVYDSLALTFVNLIGEVPFVKDEKEVDNFDKYDIL